MKIVAPTQEEECPIKKKYIWRIKKCSWKLKYDSNNKHVGKMEDKVEEISQTVTQKGKVIEENRRKKYKRIKSKQRSQTS